MDNTAFDFKRIAEGYKNRPFLHKQVIERFQQDVTKDIFTEGLDIGCGAGLSMKALKLICNHVTGADISENMISVAKEVCGINSDFDYIVSKAEDIPTKDPKFDIVTAAGVIQWIDREKFLNKMNQVMQENGYLIIYDFCISDQMVDNKEYTHWWNEVYLKEFPKPYRNEEVWNDQDVQEFGFHIEKQYSYEMIYEFTLDSFIEFMMIQSNVNAKIEGEGRKVEDVIKWFRESLVALFRNEKEKLIFKGYSWYLQRKKS